MNDLFPKIVVIKRNGADGPQFPLRTNECLFGRKPECDIRIQLPNVSLEHAIVRVDNDRKIKLINLSSCNPTLVNGKPINQVEIQNLDVLTISDRSFRFELPLQVQKQVKSPKNQHCLVSSTLVNTPQKKKTPKMPTPKGSPRTPPTGGSLKENIYILRRHSMPLQEEEEALATQASEETPFSVDVNAEPESADLQDFSEKREHKTQRRSKRVSFGPVLSPEQFDKDLPPATPVRRGATPKRSSISSTEPSLVACSSAKKQRSVAASPQAESIQEEECDENLPFENETPKTCRPLPSEPGQVSNDIHTHEQCVEFFSELQEEFPESKQLFQKSATPREPIPTEIKLATQEVNTPTGHRRSSLRLAGKSLSQPEVQNIPDASSPEFCAEEEVDETVLDSDDYTSDEEDDVGRAELQKTKKQMVTPLKKEIVNGIQLRQTKKKLATPLRKEIANGLQLRQTKKKLATPLKKEIANGLQLRQTKKKLATPLKKEIANGLQLRQTKKKLATPLKKEIANGIQLQRTKKKLVTPLKKEIANGLQLRQTKKKLATPLKKEIANGIQLRQTKKKLATPLKKEIANGIQLRQTKKKLATPLKKEIANGIQLRQTRKKLATPLKKEIANGIQLQQTKKKLATPLKKEIANGIQLRQTRKKLATPLKKEIANGTQLRQTKKKLATPLKKEIANGIQLRQTRKKIPTPLKEEIIKGIQLKETRKKLKTPIRMAIENGVSLRVTRNKLSTRLQKDIQARPKLRQTTKALATPVRNEIKLRPKLRKTMKTMNPCLQDEIKRGSKLRKTKKTMPLELQIEIINGKKLTSTIKSLPTPLKKAINAGVPLKKTKKSLPTPIRRQVEEGIALKNTNKSLKRRRSEHGMPTSEPKKLKLSSSDESTESDEELKVTQVRRALKTPLRKAIAAGTKLRPPRRRMATPVRRQIHSKPTLRAVRRKSVASLNPKKTIPRKPTYAEIVKRPKKPIVRREFNKAEVTLPTTISGDVQTKPEISGTLDNEVQPKESRENTSIAEKKTPGRKSTSWMSSLARATNAGVKTRTTSRMADLQGVAELFLTPPAAQMTAEKSSKKATNWLSCLAKVTNGPRRRGTPVEDLVGVSEMFVTPPPVNGMSTTPREVNVVPASPEEQELHMITALKPMKTPSLRSSGKDTTAVEVVTPVQSSPKSSLLSGNNPTTPQAMLEIVEPLEMSKTPSLRQSAEEVISLQMAAPVQVSRTPSLRFAKKQSAVLTSACPAELQLEFVPPIELSKTPSVRSSGDVKAVSRKSVGNPRNGRKSLGLQGIKRLMKSPKQNNTVENCEDLFVPGVFTSPKPQPKRYSRKSEGLQGVARLLKTPGSEDRAAAESPQLDGIKAMMQTKAKLASPNFVGLRVLFKTPKTTETLDPEEHFSSELFASAKKDSIPDKDPSTKSAGRKRRDTKHSIPVIDLSSPETQANTVNKESTARTTRAKRNAPKGLTEPLPKRARRTRATGFQEDEGKPKTSPDTKTAQTKTTSRGKRKPSAVTQTTPKPFVFKRTQLDPIIEVPSPLPSINIAMKGSASPLSIRKDDDKAPHEKRRTRSATQMKAEPKAPLQSSRRGKRAETEVASSSEASTTVEVPENLSFKKRKREEGGESIGAAKEPVKIEEPKLVKTRSTRRNKVQEASSPNKQESSPVKTRITRSRSSGDSQAKNHVVNQSKVNNATRQSRRGTKTVEENVSALEETKSTRSTRSKDALEKSRDSGSTRQTRRNHAEIILDTEEGTEAQKEKRPRAIRELKGNEPKKTRSTRNTIPTEQNGGESEDTMRTRRGIKRSLQEDRSAAPPEPKRTRSSARIQTRSSSRK